MGTVRVERCPNCRAMVGEGMLLEHRCLTLEKRKLVAEQKFGGYQLHVFEEDGTFWVWLDTEVSECDGLCIGHGNSIENALADAGRVMTSTLQTLVSVDYKHRTGKATLNG